MADVSHNDPGRMYSWWWDSHISPKNSKWLLENLTDMDVNVKAMIKIIELDGDSFAKRAEMYYRKRPELRRLVEEFYRAYRALAERYDHATGSLRQAHRTIAQAFPNQVSILLNDDLTTPTTTEARTPEMDFALFDPHESQKNISHASFSDPQSVKCSSVFSEYSDSETSIEELNDLFWGARKNFNFQEMGDSKAADEIRSLRDALTKLEVEKKVNLTRYEECLERLSNLESNPDLSRLESEKGVLLKKLEESLEITSNLETKLLLAEEASSKLNKRVVNAERETENLKQALVISTEEKDGVFQKICDLEHEISQRVVETKRVNAERESKDAMLKDAEERSYMFERSNGSLHAKLGALNQELMVNQEEIGRLWTCLQEEHLRFIEAETCFQKLQEELRSVEVELRNGVQIIKDLECSNKGLHGEIHKAKEENIRLMELNICSSVTMANMQDEISRLKMIESKLQEEIDLRVDQRNALQQEIYCLKEDINDSNDKITSLIEQVKSVGLNPESFGECVKELQEEGLKLKEICQEEKFENVNLLEKNIVLENSLSDANVELEEFRRKAKALEEYCESIVGEKTVLIYENCSIEFELQLGRTEVTLLENETAELFEELQESCFRETLFEEKIHEFMEECESFEDQKMWKDMEIFQLNERVRFLEDENGNIRSQLASQIGELQESSFRETFFEGKIHEFMDECEIFEDQKRSKDMEINHLDERVRFLEGENGNFKSRLASQIGKLQESSFRESLFEEKIHEFMEECESFEEQKSSKDMEIHQLNERVRFLEGENGNFKSQLASQIAALKGCVTSLETRAVFHTKGRTRLDDSEKYQELQNHDHVFSEDLQELQARIVSLEMAAIEKNKITEQELVNSNAKLEAAMIQIEELLQPLRDPSSELVTKDIMLDQISKRSLRKISRRREDLHAPPLEIWETGDENRSIELTVNKGKGKKKTLFDEVQTDHQSGDFVLDRLDSDAQKLRNLKISVQELRKKFENDGKGGVPMVKGIENETVESQLKEAEDAVLELIDFNGNLRWILQNGNPRIERIMEQACGRSENILQLELLVREIKSLLVRDEKDRKAKIRFYDRKTRVALQDYLHGCSSKSKNMNKNKKNCCSCVQPSTMGD